MTASVAGLGSVLVAGDAAGPRSTRLDPGPVRVARAARGRRSLGAFDVESCDDPDQGYRLTVARGGRVLWESVPGRAFVTAAMADVRWTDHQGMFTPAERAGPHLATQEVTALRGDGESLVVEGTLRGAGGRAASFRWTARPLARDRLGVEVRVGEIVGGRRRRPGLVALHGRRHPGERFHGFGEQFAPFDLSGRRVPMVVREQGVGRGRQPLTLLANVFRHRAGGGWDTTYAAMPCYVTSAMRGLFLENTEYAVFDMTGPEQVTVAVWADRLHAQILAGDEPTELLRAHTGAVGRMRQLPAWTGRGAVLGLQGGTARVRRIVDGMLDAGTRVAAVWLQDWTGRRRTSFGDRLWWTWQLDRDRYPGWERLVADLRSRGVRTLTYVNPFLADPTGKPGGVPRDLFAEARERGYLVRNRAGRPYLLDQGGFDAALVDLTHPQARSWYVEVIAEEVAGVGADGWMADFGEGLPFDAVLHDGDPAQWHNRWPVAWAEVNEAACARAGLAEPVVWHRSAFGASPASARLFWAGDQLVTWDGHDGLRSALAGMLSGGVSGMTLTHSDVGGYTSVDTPLRAYRRSPELLRRWTELSVFGVLLRTHEGNRPDLQAQVYDDAESRHAFARASRMYAALADYRTEVVAEASRTGVPALRHTWLHHPSSAAARSDEQFFFGPSLLVVPVLDPGRDHVIAHLPAGRWVDLFTGRVHGDPARAVRVRLPAPMGRPAVLYSEDDPRGRAIRARLAADDLLG